MNFKNILFLIIITLFVSCESNTVLGDSEINIDPDNLLLGNWTTPVYENEVTTFLRVATLPKESYGIAFQKNNVFIERSSGFCGTPPLIFTDYEGNFSQDKTIIKIDNNLYQNNFQWEIIEISTSNLVVKRVLSEQEKEHRVLMELYEELYSIAYSVSCTNVSDWTFTAFGSKACGGPQGYIAYSTKIDTTAFLQKVESYSQAEKAFNIKWGVVSDCSITNAPQKVECNNGFPTLIY